MFSEPRISGAFEAMLGAIEAPPAPLRDITGRMARTQAREKSRHRSVWYLSACAAAAIVVLALPKVAPGFTQSIAQQIEAIMHWTPPSIAPPASVLSAMRSKAGTLAAAQSRVSFTIVPPAGVPSDAVLDSIVTSPTGVYSKAMRRWSVGSPAVYFFYHRPAGRMFSLTADRFDPREGPPSKYMFEDRGVRNGHIVLVRHDRLTWRNGDQVMSAVANDGISADEIAQIRDAMNGTPMPGVWPPRSGSIEKMFHVEFGTPRP